MALDSTQRAALAALIQSDYSSLREALGLTKAQLRAGIDATDDWVEANQASFNSALPTAAKNNLTAAQKAELLMYVITKRVNG